MISTRVSFCPWLLAALVVTGCGRGGQVKAPVSAVADHSGDIEARLRRLENSNARYAEALEFLSKIYAQQKQEADQRERDEPAPDAVFAVDITSDLKLGQVNGPATALVTIVKAFDFACPYCQRVNDTLDELVKDYGGKVRVVYKNLVVHTEVATAAHLASCAAAKQGKYIAFKNAVWEKGFLPYFQTHDASKLGQDSLLGIAKGVAGLDPARLKKDMSGDECKAFVQSDMAELEKFHVSATPTFFINGILISGALDKNSFKEIIDERFAIATATGVPAAAYYEQEVMGKGERKFRSKVDPKPVTR